MLVGCVGTAVCYLQQGLLARGLACSSGMLAQQGVLARGS